MFPLLRLPHLAIREILTEMPLFDLINFSLASSKTKMITKTITRTQKKRYKVEMRIEDTLELLVHQDSAPHYYEMTSDKSKSEKLSVAFSFDGEDTYKVQKYSEDVLKGFKQWTEYVLGILNCHISILDIYIDQYPDQNKSIIDWLKQSSKSIDSFTVQRSDFRNGFDEETIIYLLKTLKITKTLGLWIRLSRHFDMSLIPNGLEHLIISPAKFVTLQDLFSFKCSFIKISYYEVLFAEDFFQFFLSWMTAETNFNLTRFQAAICSENYFNRIVEGIPHERIDSGIVRKIVYGAREFKVNGGVDIVRIDGKRATLFVDGSFATLCMNMIVH